jgi:DMSO/TMAO reductase YedYZ molybdopterin-dependent catalytic subunit
VAQRFVTRGFVGRRSAEGGADLASRVPPGQYLTTDFPVLSAGPTPRTPLDRWSFAIEGLVQEPIRWSLDEFLALPSRDWTVDISCVTKWTKLDMRWRGAVGGSEAPARPAHRRDSGGPDA